jgi:hypothetical protein
MYSTWWSPALRRVSALLLPSILLSILLTLSVQTAYAASFTATQNGNWDDSATWGGSTPPITINSGDTVTIPTAITVTIPSGLTVTDSGNLNINTAGVVDVASGGTFTVNSGGTVTIGGADCTTFTAGRISNNGTLNINAGGSINTAYSNCITNAPSLDNYGTFDINAGGAFSVSSGGLVSAQAGGTINNSGTISAYPANTFNNAGTLNNYNVIFIGAGDEFGNSGTLNNYAGANITDQSFMSNFAGGVINDYGTINNSPVGCPGGVLSNSGAIDIHSGGVMYNTRPAFSCGGPFGTITINPGGTLTVDSGGTFSNSATLNLDTGSATTFSGPSTYSGAFTNAGSFTMLGGILEVGGSGTALVVSSGTLSIPSGVGLQVDSGASLTVDAGASLSNAGALRLDTGTPITFSGPSTYSGAFTNGGTFTMLPSSILALGSSGTALAISPGTFSIPSGVTLQVDSGASLSVDSGGTLSNSGILNNFATITNNDTITNNPGATFNNRGTVTNTATFDNAGAINNYATINTPGTLVNNDTIKNYCGAVITGTVTGNLVINACVSVTLTSSFSCSPPRLGQPITFTATVSPGTATGTVAFNDGTTTLGTSPLSGGTSTFTTGLLSAGNHSITAVYSGDPTDVGAASAASSQVVLPSWVFPTATASLVDNSPGNDLFEPQVDGNLVAYSGFDGNNSFVKYFDLTTGCGELIATGGTEDFLTDVSGSKIAFTHIDFTHAAIDVFDTSTPTAPPVEIDPQAGSFRQDSQIGGNTVAWQDVSSTGQSSDIVVWDMSTSTAKRLTSNGHINQLAGVSRDGSAVVWADCPAFTNCNIFASRQTATDIWSGAVQLTTTGTCSGSRPDTNGQVAVYSCADSAGVGHVYLQPLAGGTVTQVPFAGSASNPSISGGWVSFSGQATSATSHSIYVYSIATGAVSQLPTPPGENTSNDITRLPSGQVNVVWQNAQASLAIYAFALVGNFSLSPVSPMTVGVGGSTSTTVTVNSVGSFSSPVTFTASGTPGGIAASFSPNPVTPSSGSSVSSTLSLSAQPFVTPQTFTLTVTGTSASPALTHSTTVSVSVTATTSSTSSLINSLLAAGCIDNAGVANSFISKLTTAQASISAGAYTDAINTLKALISQLKAQAGKHLSTSCTINGVTFNPVTVLINDVQSMIDTLSTTIIPDPVTGYVLTSTGTGISGATVSITDSSSNVVATATTDVTGFYFFSNTSILTAGSTYTVKVTSFPTGFTTSSPASQTVVWSGTATVIGNFVLS